MRSIICSRALVFQDVHLGGAVVRDLGIVVGGQAHDPGLELAAGDLHPARIGGAEGHQIVGQFLEDLEELLGRQGDRAGIEHLGVEAVADADVQIGGREADAAILGPR